MKEQSTSFETNRRGQESSWLENLHGGRARNLALGILAALAFSGCEKPDDAERNIPAQQAELLTENQKIEKLNQLLGKAYVDLIRSENRHNTEIGEVPHFEPIQINRYVHRASTSVLHEISTANMEQFFLQGLPQNWIAGEIKGIKQATKSLKRSDLRHEVGSAKDGEIAGTHNRTTKLIHFYPKTKEMYSSSFDHLANHEAAHANDWLTDDTLTASERIAVLFQVAERITAPDRYKSSYVESIEMKDAQTTQRIRCHEYFAEISAVYFTRPDTLHIKDYRIVDSVVRRNDPNFDFDKARAVRYAAMGIDLNNL